MELTKDFTVSNPGKNIFASALAKFYENNEDNIIKFKEEIELLQSISLKEKQYRDDYNLNGYKSFSDLIECYWNSELNNIKRKIKIDFIIIVVCDYFSLSPKMIHMKTRKREIVCARQIAMFFSKNLTKSSLATIGLKIGGKDHATVLHACKTVNNLSDTDKRFRFQVKEIEEKLKSNYLCENLTN